MTVNDCYQHIATFFLLQVTESQCGFMVGAIYSQSVTRTYLAR